MVNPDHNGGQFEYQWQTGGGRPGKTDAALLDELIDHNVLWFSWAYGVTPDAPTSKGIYRIYNSSPGGKKRGM